MSTSISFQSWCLSENVPKLTSFVVSPTTMGSGIFLEEPRRIGNGSRASQPALWRLHGERFPGSGRSDAFPFGLGVRRNCVFSAPNTFALLNRALCSWGFCHLMAGIMRSVRFCSVGEPVVSYWLLEFGLQLNGSSS